MKRWSLLLEESALRKKENHYPGRRFLFKMGGKMIISTTKKTNHLRLLWTDPEVVLVFLLTVTWLNVSQFRFLQLLYEVCRTEWSLCRRKKLSQGMLQMLQVQRRADCEVLHARGSAALRGLLQGCLSVAATGVTVCAGSHLSQLQPVWQHC